MTIPRRIAALVVAGLVTVGAYAAVSAPDATADASPPDSTADASPPDSTAETGTTSTPINQAARASRDVACPQEGEPLDTALLYIEHNATDGDTGVHGFFGGEAWTGLCVHSPDRELILGVRPTGQLRDLGIADLFFESREPPNDEVSIADVKAAFPEGGYQVSGIDFEGNPRVGTARFTHAIPAEPVIVSPELTEEERADELIIDTSDLAVQWEPVTETIDGDPITVAGYEVIVTTVDHDDPDAQSRPIFDVHVPPDVTSLDVLPGFFEPDTLYELEVLALEESGNQTISLGFFTSSSDAEADTIEYEEVRTFIEYNAADGDYGFHLELGAEPWQTTAISGPDGGEILGLRATGSLGHHGLSSMFFESAEYGADEVTREEFLERFPEGDYEFTGRTVDGEVLVGIAEFSHLIPDPPVIVAPAADAVIDSQSVVIRWDQVARPNGVEPEVYQLQLFPVDPDPGQDPIDLNIDYTLEVPASVNEIKIPPELLAPGVDYTFELLVVDASGNQAFSVGTFTTAE